MVGVTFTMVDPIFFLQQLINGVSVGSLYVLFALGLTIVYGVQRILHIAHGIIFVEAAYVSLASFYLLGNLPVSLVLAVAVAGLTGICLDLIIYRPLAKVSGRHGTVRTGMAMLVVSVAAFVFMQDGIKIIFGARPMTWPVNLGGVTIEFLGAMIFMVHLANILVAIASIIFLWYFLYRTKVGLALRAVSQDALSASNVGINPYNIVLVAFLVASIFAGLTGALTGILYNRMIPYMGLRVIIVGLAVILLGGLGSILGSILGGFLMGIAETFFISFMPIALPRDTVSFLVILIVLIIKPKGLSSLWGREKIRKVA